MTTAEVELVVAPRRRAALPALPPWTILAFGAFWALVVVVPLVLTVIYSFLSQGLIGPEWTFTTHAYSTLPDFGRGETVLRTFRIALEATAIEFVLAFPTAYWLAKRVRSRLLAVTILVLLTVPFFLSEDARTVVWQAVYSRNGLINTVLQDV